MIMILMTASFVCVVDTDVDRNDDDDDDDDSDVIVKTGNLCRFYVRPMRHLFRESHSTPISNATYTPAIYQYA